jgi:hypothetical protein
MSNDRELAIPEVAARDPRSLEILRVWVANKAQHMSVRTGVWRDPAARGIMLVDLARHIANAYAESAGRDPRQSLQRIRAGWDAEMGTPTDGGAT